MGKRATKATDALLDAFEKGLEADKPPPKRKYTPPDSVTLLRAWERRELGYDSRPAVRAGPGRPPGSPNKPKPFDPLRTHTREKRATQPPLEPSNVHDFFGIHPNGQIYRLVNGRLDRPAARKRHGNGIASHFEDYIITHAGQHTLANDVAWWLLRGGIPEGCTVKRVSVSDPPTFSEDSIYLIGMEAQRGEGQADLSDLDVHLDTPLT